MTADEIAGLFTTDGRYRFARWGRAVAPVVFGVEDDTLALIRGAIEQVLAVAGLPMAARDPELGANAMLFFFREWEELLAVPDLEALVARLGAREAARYRLFRFDEAGAIRACFSFVRMGGALAEAPADVLAMQEALGLVLTWAPGALERAPAAMAPLQRDEDGRLGLSAPAARLLAAAHDPALPAVADDPSHALRLWARMQ